MAARARELAPDSARISFGHAATLTANGRAAEARVAMDDALRPEPRLVEFARRYAESGRAGALAPILREPG